MTYQEKIQKNKTLSEPLERRVIGSMENPKFKTMIFTSVRTEYFHNSDLRKIFTFMKDSLINEKDFYMALGEAKLALEYSKCQQSSVYTTSELETLINDFRALYAKSTIEAIVTEFSEKEAKDPIAFSSELVSKLLEVTTDNETERSDMKDVVEDFERLQDEYAERFKNGQKYIGLETGMEKIDAMIDGIRPGHLWVVGGYTSSGKTFWALNVMNALINQRKKVTFYSLEMTNEDLLNRLLGIRTGIQSEKILKGFLGFDESKAINEAKEDLKKSKAAIFQKKSRLEHILMGMQSELVMKKVDCFFLDYGQLVQSDKQNEYDTMSEMAIQLQTFSKRNKVPIILLSQISNEHARNQVSNVMGFKGSGAIAASADIAIELRSGEENNEEKFRKMKQGEPITVIAAIKKNRHGRTGEVYLDFHTRSGRIQQQKGLEEY